MEIEAVMLKPIEDDHFKNFYKLTVILKGSNVTLKNIGESLIAISDEFKE